MTDDTTPQPARKIIGDTIYLPDSQTATFTDSNNKETVIKNITHEQYNQISAEFIAKSTLSSTSKTSNYSKSLAGSALMGAWNRNKRKQRLQEIIIVD